MTRLACGCRIRVTLPGRNLGPPALRGDVTALLEGDPSSGRRRGVVFGDYVAHPQHGPLPGLLLVLTVALGGALVFDFLFWPPAFSFVSTDLHIAWLSFISAAVAVAVSRLAERARRRTKEAEGLAREVRRTADEQAALRRVATLVARGAAPEEVFVAVTAEIGRVLAVDLTVRQASVSSFTTLTRMSGLPHSRAARRRGSRRRRRRPVRCALRDCSLKPAGQAPWPGSGAPQGTCAGQGP